MDSKGSDSNIGIVGAGPAGLASAVTLARAGLRVIVHEAQREVGYRLQGDLQGLENWTAGQDVLAELDGLGLTTAFETLACREGTAFDAWGRAYPVRSRAPLFYTVARGSGPGTLDAALLAQARGLGVEVRFNDRLAALPGRGVLAVGPKAADAIAVGYHFETAMPDGFWLICNDDLAPQGYAYLLVMRGRGTVKSCMFSAFKQEQVHVERTVEAFGRLVGLQMNNPRPHGGVGNFRLPASALSGPHPVAGEQAGFQDALFGFGMRYAMRSGVLAARSLIEGRDYDILWRDTLAPHVRSAMVGRAAYGLAGNGGYRWLLRLQARRDAREFLNRLYRPSWLKALLMPWARRRFRSRRRDASCDHVDCRCIWCRCGGHVGQETRT
jgi:flavin-dependent dehydrogenase